MTMTMRSRLTAAIVLVSVLAIGAADCGRARAQDIDPTIATVCALIETSASQQGLPVAFLTRLIWRESSFRRRALSPAGAQGIAQFMPGTADDQGLADPFDPEQAIPKAAGLLAAQQRRFGNLGLAAAAYNAGSTRVANWLARQASLPDETRDYVLAITGLLPEAWRDRAESPALEDAASCVKTLADIRRTRPDQASTSALLAPWGVQLTGAISKEVALRAYRSDQSRFRMLLGAIEPMIIGGRKAGRGFRPFYQVRAPSPSRAAATTLCAAILRVGGACTVLRSRSALSRQAEE